MKHARPDYAPIQDPRGKIPDDEPVFLLRGQDQIAITTLAFYAASARRVGLEAVAVATERQINAMTLWQIEHKSKLPDLNPAGAPFDPLRDGKPPVHRPLVAIDPQSRAGKEPCGECHIRPGETCDICGAFRSIGEPPAAVPTLAQRRMEMVCDGLEKMTRSSSVCAGDRDVLKSILEWANAAREA